MRKETVHDAKTSKVRQAFCETLPIFFPQFLRPRRWGRWGRGGQETLLRGHGVRAPSRPRGCTGAAVDQAAAQQLAVRVDLMDAVQPAERAASLEPRRPRAGPGPRAPRLLCLLARGLRQPLPGFGEKPSGSEAWGALMVHMNILCVSLFKCVSSSDQVVKGLEFQLQHQFFQWTFRTDFH